jgi:hypothetical protein
VYHVGWQRKWKLIYGEQNVFEKKTIFRLGVLRMAGAEKPCRDRAVKKKIICLLNTDEGRD